jgi:hypothetical protein
MSDKWREHWTVRLRGLRVICDDRKTMIWKRLQKLDIN